jgi:alanyl-tRNA synthetase
VLFTVPQPSAVVIARAADGTIDSAAVLKKLIERFGGKGGGRPDLAQGGGLQGTTDDITTCARGLL